MGVRNLQEPFGLSRDRACRGPVSKALSASFDTLLRQAQQPLRMNGVGAEGAEQIQ
ncbi:hypothetical protein L286_20285 [Sphingobium sp. HDIP04]|nr:hypothetical protein L286_20285 [Sphingobium sp. HDIP04]